MCRTLSCSTEQSIYYVNYFKKKGADIVSLIFGEKYYTDKQIYLHFKKIHDKTNCFLMLHQQILENGISSNPPFVYYSIDLLNKISNLSRFIAMKEDAKNEIYTKRICQKVSNKMIIITSGGGKRQWLAASKFGCTSWLSGVSNLNPKIAVDFYNFYKLRKTKQMNIILKYIEDPFFKIKDKYGWHLTIKAFLELNKNYQKFERSPLKEIDKKGFFKCKQVYEKNKKTNYKTKIRKISQMSKSKKKTKIIAFIPARSGSTRVKNKNIRLIKDRPLIYWSIYKAIISKVFDKIIFSSDSTYYYKLLTNYLKKDKLVYKNLTFDKRDKLHSKVNSKIFDYLKFDLIKKYKLNKGDLLVQMLPTCPLRSVKTIKNTINYSLQKNRNCFSVSEYDFHITFGLSIKNDKWTLIFKKSPMITGKHRVKLKKILSSNGSN